MANTDIMQRFTAAEALRQTFNAQTDSSADVGMSPVDSFLHKNDQKLMNKQMTKNIIKCLCRFPVIQVMVL